MGKSTTTTANCHNSIYDNGDQSGGGGGVNGGTIPSIGNLLVYILCVFSLGFSIYTSYRQTHLEDRMHHIRHLDERITILEAKYQNYHLTYPSSSQSVSTNVDSKFSDVVRKLSLEVAGIQRLRRDVSHLQVTRSQRQTASASTVQQTPPECVCPPGMHKLNKKFKKNYLYNLNMYAYVYIIKNKIKKLIE